jgi:hypothetical protein
MQRILLLAVVSDADHRHLDALTAIAELGEKRET